MPACAGNPDEAFGRLMNEEAIQFGPGGRLLGILTTSNAQPGASNESIVFVFLNAGLLHRPGSYRLHVRLARALAEHGFHSLRVDLGGFGDSLAEPDLEYEQSVVADFSEILQFLESEFGSLNVILFGLCGGADNAVRLAVTDSRVKGMILLDPVCEQDDGFPARARALRRKTVFRKAQDPSRYAPWLKRRLSGENSNQDPMDVLSVRAMPSAEQTRAAFSAIRERNGHVLSIFTSYAMSYYNEAGQLGRVLDLPDYDAFCEEKFRPHVLHTYPFEPDRQRLIDEIRDWASRVSRGFVSATVSRDASR